MESSATFKVTGTVRLRSRKDPDHPRPLSGVQIEVLDLDRFRHDLLASGRTRRDGSFRFSCIVDEFNQDPGEDEHLPELWITCLRTTEAGDRVPIESCGIGWVPGGVREAHVDIVIDEWMLALPTAERVPRASKRDRSSIDVTPELLATLADEIAPEVERLTGWNDVSDGLRFAVGDEFISVNAHVMALIPQGARWVVGPVLDYLSSVWMGAVFDPTTRTILVNERLTDVNSDGLRVLLGHELVHAAQFAAYPALIDEISAAAAEMLEVASSGGSHDDIVRTRSHRLGVELEGQATWVERRLRSELHLARIDLGLNWVAQIVQGFALRMNAAKVQQYRHGLSVMEERSAQTAAFPAISSTLLGPAD